MQQKHKDRFTDQELISAYNKEPTLGRLAAKFLVPDITIFRRAQKLGLTFVNGGYQKPIALDEILDGQHPQYPTPHLKRRLLKEGVKSNKCEECGITEWNKKPLSMHLDHVDGNSKNHKLKNLRILCPNCHAQTPTYCGKNKIKAE